MLRKFAKIGAVFALSLSLVGCGNNATTGQKENAESSDKKVILITMDSTDLHWVSVNEGAEKAAKELGNVNYKWMAPDKKDDAQQIERINNAIADGANAIMIAANGRDSVSGALEEAKSEGIKIIYVDSPASVEAEATFATNNIKAGELAAQEMIKNLESKNITSGKIGVVNFNASADTAIQRDEGFRKAMKNSKFEVLETQYSDGDASKSQDISDNYITDGVVGIFATNEGCTVGAGNAIKGSKSDVVGVGFDKSDAILSLVEDGSLLATMAQKPEEMGYEGMKAAISVLDGKEIEDKKVDTGVSVITKETLKK